MELKELLMAGVSCSSREEENSRKRKGKGVAGEATKKKREVEEELTGRLLLWNRPASSHPCSNSLDCLAFCDGGGAAVCCTVQSLDVSLLGQRVQLNSWTFVPGAKHSDKVCIAEDCDTAQGRNETELERNAKSGEDCGGCVEIRSLKRLEESFVPAAQAPEFPSLCLSPAAANARNVVLESPLEKVGKSKPHLKIRGCLYCISPPFQAPSIQTGTVSGQGPQKTLFKDEGGSRVQSDSQSMLGYLVELRSCCHQKSPCGRFSDKEVVDDCENGTAAIYFSGGVASWRPLLGELLGDCIAISGLRRKMIRLGPEKKEFYIYVATRTSLVSPLSPPVVDSYDASSFKELRFQMQPRTVPHGDAGQGLRSYVGTVTRILLEDQLVELDEKVWLLLTHYKHTQVHGLRVGALVAMRHAHIMTLKTISEKVLVLGACVRSHVWVVLHSVCNAGSRIIQASQSRLSKYIGSLPFAWAFWIIHVIVSLSCKFKGVYSDKELLGSMKHAGLVRKVLPSMMGTPATLQRDAFKEFLLHKHSCLLGDTSAAALLTKLPPLSNFCDHVAMLWVDPASSIWHERYVRSVNWESSTRFCKPLVSQTSCFIRNIISGAKQGIVLLGSLEICQSTGKLQLVDATGVFDVVVPDLRSLSNLHCVYQIAKYKLVMEGECGAPHVSAAGNSNNVPSSLSWSSLLKGSKLENRKPQSLSYYVKFYLQYAKRLEGLTWPSQLQNNESEASTSDVKNDPADAWKGKEFNIGLITHKYPVRHKYSLDKEKLWAFDVEVVLLPYNLVIHHDNDLCSTMLIPPFQNDVSSKGVQGQRQRQRPEQLGSTRTHAHGSTSGDSRCRIDCSVCCLVEQWSGLKTISVQPCCTLSASLATRGCFKRAPILGSGCATKEEHWTRLSESELQKIVLAFNRRSIEISQVFNTGDWCLLPALQDKAVPVNSSELSSALKRVEVDAKQSLISLQWKHAIGNQVSEADAKFLENMVKSSRRMKSTYVSQKLSESDMELEERASGSEEYTRKTNLRRRSSTDVKAMSEGTLIAEPQLVDVVVTLSCALGDELRDWLASLKGKLIPKMLSVSEVLRFTHPITMSTKSGESYDIFSAGVVVSVTGKLEAVKCSSDDFSTGDDGLIESMFPSFSTQRQTTLFHLKDLCTHDLIRIQINFDKYVRPLGFGHGVVACFRRILLRRDENLLVGIPTTDVFIESVVEGLYALSHINELRYRDRLLPEDEQGCAENVKVIDLLNDFISKSEPRKKHLKLHCRVVSVQEVELEWLTSQTADTMPVRDEMAGCIAVKCGCFIIDDGSAIAECWAKGDQASKLLGLHGSAADVSTCCSSMIGSAQLSSHSSESQPDSGGSPPQVLSSMVRRHKRIWVQGEPPQGDLWTTSWLMQGVDSDLEESEAMILTFVLEKACQRGPTVVHCAPVSKEDHILNRAEEFHRAMGNPLAKPRQNLTQLFATKVDVSNSRAGLQQLISDTGVVQMLESQ